MPGMHITRHNTHFNEPLTMHPCLVATCRYAISVARKLGATIFLMPEDIVECRPKLITTFISGIMAKDSWNA